MDNITQFSLLKEEPEWLYHLRIASYQQLLHRKDNAVLETMDERDEQGFGVLPHLATEQACIIQYGTLTTFEQLDMISIEKGVILCDIFEALQNDYPGIKRAFEQLFHTATQESESSQRRIEQLAYFNSGIYVYVPKNTHFSFSALFVQDNNVEELCYKQIIIVREDDATVDYQTMWQSFGTFANERQCETYEYVLPSNLCE